MVRDVFETVMYTTCYLEGLGVGMLKLNCRILVGDIPLCFNNNYELNCSVRTQHVMFILS